MMASSKSEDFYITLAKITQTSNHPYFLHPRWWDDFDHKNIKILRNNFEFNKEL